MRSRLNFIGDAVKRLAVKARFAPVVAVAALACSPHGLPPVSLPSPPPGVGRVVIQHESGILQTIDLSTAEWAVGDTVRIGSRLTNQSSDSLDMGYRDCTGTLRRSPANLILESTVGGICGGVWVGVLKAPPGFSVAHVTQRFVLRGRPGDYVLEIQGTRPDHYVSVPVRVRP
jgi:hypothetical protein